MAVNKFENISAAFSADKILVLVSVGIFFAHHFYSFLHNFKSDRDKKPNIGVAVILPLVRIAPMHLMIMIGVLVAQILSAIFGEVGPLGMFIIMLVFMKLKTAADLMMHTLEHSEDPILMGDIIDDMFSGDIW